MEQSTIKNQAAQRWPRYFSYKPGRNGCDDTFDIISVITGECIASLPYWEEKEQTRKETEQLIDALHAFIYRGGSLFEGNLLNAMPPEENWDFVNGEIVESDEPHWTTKPIEGLSWTVSDVLAVRPDLLREEAYGVLWELKDYVDFGYHVCPDVIRGLANATFPPIEVVVPA